MRLGVWKCAALLLLVAAGPAGIAIADSPHWADEQMLVLWPSALHESPLPTIVRQPSVSVAGHSSLSDWSDEPVDPANLWEGDGSNAATEPIEPVVNEQWLPGHQTLRDCNRCEGWQVLPAGILYKSYLAGEKEPRMATAYLYEKDRGAVLESTIGGRLGFLRYGTDGPINPEGVQWDLEGAALLRQDPEEELDVEATDFRVGTVLTWRRGPTAAKAGYYHLSSHLGDEFLLRYPNYNRLNYVRDSLLIGVHHNLRPDLAIYGEIAYAFKTDGGAEPLELQFGVEYTPIELTDRIGAPVVAINGHLREEFDFGGGVNVIAGWEWRGPHSNRRLRVGAQFYSGKEIQWSFYDESVTFIGGGIWYDF